MLSGTGSLPGGKQTITKLSAKNKMAKMLITSPYFPREKEHLSSGRPLRRNMVMEPMDTMYEERRATRPSEVSWLKAMVEPNEMLMSRVEQIVVARMALRGTSQPGGTCNDRC